MDSVIFSTTSTTTSFTTFANIFFSIINSSTNLPTQLNHCMALERQLKSMDKEILLSPLYVQKVLASGALGLSYYNQLFQTFLSPSSHSSFYSFLFCFFFSFSSSFYFFFFSFFFFLFHLQLSDTEPWSTDGRCM